MATPKRIPERKVWRGDPYEIRIVFRNPDGTLRDVSGGAWVPSLSNDSVSWEVDASDAENGVVLLMLTAAQTAALTEPFVSWDLFEGNLWNRTLFFGRLVMEGE